MAKVQVACPQCGKQVECYPSQLRSDGTKLCSLQCQRAARRASVDTRTCEHCHEEFLPHRANRETARFCSDECYRANTGPATLTCEKCGDGYYVRPSDVERAPNKGKYCPDCYISNKGNPRAERVTLTCHGCGKTVVRKLSEASGTGRAFCTVECQMKQRSVITMVCPPCGREFRREARKAITASGYPACCSTQCAATLRAKRPIPENTPQVAAQCQGCGETFTHPKARLRRYCTLDCARGTRLKTAKQCLNCGAAYEGYSNRKFCSRDCFYERQALTSVGTVTRGGYRLVTVNGRQVPEHRHLMSQLLGRPLLPNETVHHLNTDRSDNSTDGPLRWVNGSLRSGNLELWVKSQPSGGRLGETGPFDAELYPAAV